MDPARGSAAVEWRFGGLPGDPEAWYAAPSLVHVYVDVRTPETPSGRWHRIWAVTQSWVATNVLIPEAEGAIVPPLLVVRDGSPAELRERVGRIVQSSSHMIVLSATLLDADHREAEW